jgi:hypothetical protein
MKCNHTRELSALAAYIVDRWGSPFHKNYDVVQVLSVPKIGETITKLAKGFTLYEPDQTLTTLETCSLVVALSVIYHREYQDFSDDGQVWSQPEGSVVFYRTWESLMPRSTYPIIHPVLVAKSELDEESFKIHKKEFADLSYKEKLGLPIDAKRFDILVCIRELLSEVGVTP